MKSIELTLSKKKMLIFGIIVDLMVSAILSFGSYDIINAFYGQIMPVKRIHFFLVLFPNIFVIIGAVIVSYTLLSIKYKTKDK